MEFSDVYVRHTPPENAISTLKAFVLFSTLASDLMPFKMPTMIAKMTISPTEQTANDMFDMRFLAMDS